MQAAKNLRACSQLLDEEERADLALRQQWGERWTLPHSSVLAATHRSTISTYHTLLQTAAEKDAMPLQKLEANRGRLEGLSIDNARSRLPHLEQPMVSIGAADPATVVANLRGAMVGLEALGTERDGLEDRVKSAKDADDILPELLQGGTSDTAPIFEEHLKRYEPLRRGVDTNVQRQAELLQVIAANMSSFRTVFDVAGWQQECEQVSGAVHSARLCCLWHRRRALCAVMLHVDVSDLGYGLLCAQCSLTLRGGCRCPFFCGLFRMM